MLSCEICVKFIFLCGYAFLSVKVRYNSGMDETERDGPMVAVTKEPSASLFNLIVRVLLSEH